MLTSPQPIDIRWPCIYNFIGYNKNIQGGNGISINPINQVNQAAVSRGKPVRTGKAKEAALPADSLNAGAGQSTNLIDPSRLSSLRTTNKLPIRRLAPTELSLPVENCTPLKHSPLSAERKCGRWM